MQKIPVRPNDQNESHVFQKSRLLLPPRKAMKTKVLHGIRLRDNAIARDSQSGSMTIITESHDSAVATALTMVGDLAGGLCLATIIAEQCTKCSSIDRYRTASNATRVPDVRSRRAIIWVTHTFASNARPRPSVRPLYGGHPEVTQAVDISRINQSGPCTDTGVDDIRNESPAKHGDFEASPTRK